MEKQDVVKDVLQKLSEAWRVRIVACVYRDKTWGRQRVRRWGIQVASGEHIWLGTTKDLQSQLHVRARIFETVGKWIAKTQNTHAGLCYLLMQVAREYAPARQKRTLTSRYVE